jgi:hypothetical protein
MSAHWCSHSLSDGKPRHATLAILSCAMRGTDLEGGIRICLPCRRAYKRRWRAARRAAGKVTA